MSKALMLSTLHINLFKFYNTRRYTLFLLLNQLVNSRPGILTQVLITLILYFFLVHCTPPSFTEFQLSVHSIFIKIMAPSSWPRARHSVRNSAPPCAQTLPQPCSPKAAVSPHLSCPLLSLCCVGTVSITQGTCFLKHPTHRKK